MVFFFRLCHTTIPTAKSVHRPAATDGSIWSATNIGYAPNGNVLSGNDSQNGNWSYTYDDFNRLRTATKPGLGFSYAYDRLGNRWQQNLTAGSGPSPQYSFDANNHITGSSVTYDAAGNVVNTAGYIYDSGGRRAQATTASGTQDFLFDQKGKAITAIRASDGTWLRGEIWSPIGYLATYVNSTTYFNHSDWLMTVRARSTSAGSLAEGYTSLPFGDALSGTGVSPVHFTGDERDSEDNLDHFSYRQYSSTEGRWMSPDPGGLAAFDPLNPQSLNRYVYVLDSPCGFYDEFGLDVCTLNIKVNNKSNLNQNQLDNIQARINDIYGATPTSDGNSTAVNFIYTGKGDYGLTFTPGNPNGNTGLTIGWGPIWFSPKVYTAATLNDYGTSNFDIATGSTAAHELTHRVTHIRDQPFSGSPNLMNADSAISQGLGSTVTADDVNPNPQGFDLLTQSQADDLYKRCLKKHPGQGGSSGGGTGYSDGLQWGFWTGGSWGDEGYSWWGFWGWWPVSHPHPLQPL
jgi:RHS repeat-associated protein